MTAREHLSSMKDTAESRSDERSAKTAAEGRNDEPRGRPRGGAEDGRGDEQSLLSKAIWHRARRCASRTRSRRNRVGAAVEVALRVATRKARGWRPSPSSKNCVLTHAPQQQSLERADDRLARSSHGVLRPRAWRVVR